MAILAWKKNCIQNRVYRSKQQGCQILFSQFIKCEFLTYRSFSSNRSVKFGPIWPKLCMPSQKTMVSNICNVFRKNLMRSRKISKKHKKLKNLDLLQFFKLFSAVHQNFSKNVTYVVNHSFLGGHAKFWPNWTKFDAPIARK